MPSCQPYALRQQRCLPQCGLLHRLTCGGLTPPIHTNTYGLTPHPCLANPLQHTNTHHTVSPRSIQTQHKVELDARDAGAGRAPAPVPMQVRAAAACRVRACAHAPFFSAACRCRCRCCLLPAYATSHSA